VFVSHSSKRAPCAWTVANVERRTEREGQNYAAYRQKHRQRVESELTEHDNQNEPVEDDVENILK
jgi:hypothetical protein